MKRLLPVITRRELLLVSLTAAVCFSIAIPISGAATHARVPVPLRVAPGGSVLFPNLNWQCWSAAKTTGTNSNGTQWTIPAAIACYEPSSGRIVGKRISVSRKRIVVFRCTNGGDCSTLGHWRRTP